MRPEPTWIRAARGPMPARTPRLDALILTPGATRIPNPILTMLSALGATRNRHGALFGGSPPGVRRSRSACPVIAEGHVDRLNVALRVAPGAAETAWLPVGLVVRLPMHLRPGRFLACSSLSDLLVTA